MEKNGWRESPSNKRAVMVNFDHNHRIFTVGLTVSFNHYQGPLSRKHLHPPDSIIGFFCYNTKLKEGIMKSATY